MRVMNRFKSLLMTGCLVTSSIAMSKEISVMSYNLENLFDTKHDKDANGKDKHDYTYLPLAVKTEGPLAAEVQAHCKAMSSRFYRASCFNLDWTEEKLNQKIKNLAKLVRSYNDGKGPDVLVVQEVENINVLKQFVDQGLAHMGYRSVVLLEGDDRRGIDVGVVSRFKVVGTPVLHKVPTDWKKDENQAQVQVQNKKPRRPTRPILEVQLKIGGKTVVFYANHWPSQANPDEYRKKAAETLIEAAKNHDDKVIMAMGDFNTLEDDRPNSISDVATNPSNGLGLFFQDAVKEAIAAQTAQQLFGGTHWYRGHFSYLDRIFYYIPASDSSTQAKVETIHTATPDFSLKTIDWFHKNGRRDFTPELQKKPYRWDSVVGIGGSDHIPLSMQVNI